MASPRTLLEALIQKLRGCNVSSDAEVDPVAVLWTDPRSEWKPLIPLLRQQLPELACLGDYAPEHQPAGSACPTRRSAPDGEHACGVRRALHNQWLGG